MLAERWLLLLTHVQLSATKPPAGTQARSVGAKNALMAYRYHVSLGASSSIFRAQPPEGGMMMLSTQPACCLLRVWRFIAALEI